MMRRATLACAAVAAMLGCGSNEQGSEAPAVRPSEDVVRDAEPRVADASSPDAARVDPVPCKSDKDCKAAGGVCDPLYGACVECVLATDCGAGERCVLGECAAVVPCESPKDCPAGSGASICDPAEGVCVQCLDASHCDPGHGCAHGTCVAICDMPVAGCLPCSGHAECPPPYHCFELGPSQSVCVADACTAGQKSCAPGGLVSCNGAGDGWGEPSPCGPARSCVASGLGAACVEWICDPGHPYCEGGSAILCADDGMSVLSSTDCAGLSAICVAGACVDSPCPTCESATAGPGGDSPFAPDPTSSFHVVVTGDGGVTLPAASLDLHVLWVSGSKEGRVSKLDTKTGYELGRYAVCTDPSRTAVNQIGDGWIACRSDNATVAYVHNHEAMCDDRNGNGIIDTSRDTNGDHVIGAGEVLPPGQDECVAWTKMTAGIPENPKGNIARAIGLDSGQRAWVGVWEAKKLLLLEPENGDVLDGAGIPAQPYGLVVDADDVVWVSGRADGLLVRYDPADGSVASLKPKEGYSPYGIALDHKGRIWTPHLGSGGNMVHVYDPKTETWGTIPIPARGRGLVGDLKGRIFVACDESNEVAVIDADQQVKLAGISLGPNRFPIGMARDSDGFVWAVNQTAETVIRIDPVTLSVAGEFPVGKEPYTYSDMTGTRFFGLPTPGFFRHTFVATNAEGLFAVATWKWLSIGLSGSPAATLALRVRAASTKEALAAADWSIEVGPFGKEGFPIDLSLLVQVPAAFVEVEVWLHPGADGALPVVDGIQAFYEVLPEG